MMKPGVHQAVYPVLLGAAAGAVSVLGFAELSLSALDAGDIATRFLSLVMVATVIERAVEIYVVGRFGPVPEGETEAAEAFRAKKARAAQALSVGLSFAVAAVGFRVLGQYLPLDPESGRPLGIFGAQQGQWQLALFRFVDIILSTLVLAGGAEGIHRITKRLG